MDDKLFAIMRFNILTAALNPATEHLLSDACVYAWDRRVYPLDEAGYCHKPFAASFAANEEMMTEFAKYLDKQWIAKEVPTFYQIEDHYDLKGFGGKETNWDRMSLVFACRYMKLTGWFDKEFWTQLLTPSEHPIEAESIAQPYDRKKDLYLP